MKHYVTRATYKFLCCGMLWLSLRLLDTKERGAGLQMHTGLRKGVLGGTSHAQSTRVMNCLRARHFLTPHPCSDLYSFKYFWLALLPHVSNIPSWLPHVQALASNSLLQSDLLGKGTVGPHGFHFSSTSSRSHISEISQIEGKKEKLKYLSI